MSGRLPRKIPKMNPGRNPRMHPEAHISILSDSFFAKSHCSISQTRGFKPLSALSGAMVDIEEVSIEEFNKVKGKAAISKSGKVAAEILASLKVGKPIKVEGDRGLQVSLSRAIKKQALKGDLRAVKT